MSKRDDGGGFIVQNGNRTSLHRILAVGTNLKPWICAIVRASCLRRHDFTISQALLPYVR